VLHRDRRWYTHHVPTSLPRFQVTETPAVERALAIAARERPDASRSELVLWLFERGAGAIERDHEDRFSSRRRAVDQDAGEFTDAYPPGYLADLRADWPE
jgi:hypothetical protein